MRRGWPLALMLCADRYNCLPLRRRSREPSPGSEHRGAEKGNDSGLRELVVLLLLSGFGCGLAMAQGDLMFVAIFGAACAMTLLAGRRLFP